MAVVGGFVEIKKNGNDVTEVAVLADFAERVRVFGRKKSQTKARAEQKTVRE